MGQLFLIAVRNLLQHRRRTLLLGGAIAGVSAILVIVLSLLTGIRQTIMESATTMQTGHVNVGGFYKVTAGASAPAVTDYEKALAVVKKEIPADELDYITARGRGWAKLVSDTGSIQSGVGGIDITTEQGFRRVLKLREGKLEDLAQPNTALLFKSQADKLGVKVGDQATLIATTLRGASNTVDLRIAAIAEDLGLMSSFNIFVPQATLRGLYAMNDQTTGVLQIYLKDMRTIPKVQERLRKAFKDAGYRVLDDDPRAFWFKFESVNREDWTGQGIDITNWEGEVSFIQWIVALMGVLGSVLTFVLLVIICAGVMNVLWISIRERTREVGTLRAVGMQQGTVLRMFMVEGFTLSAVSAVAGALFGVLVGVVVNAAHFKVPMAAQFILMRDTLQLNPPVAGIVGAIILITLCTTFVSLFPSYRASRLKPVTAMQFHG